MKVLVTMQIAWGTIVLVISALQFLLGRHFVTGLIAFVVGVYLYASVVLLERLRWAWLLCFLPPLGSLVLFGPTVAYNLWRASQDDPLFSDSPGTLLVVLFMTFVYVIPPIMILLRLVIVRGEIPARGWRCSRHSTHRLGCSVITSGTRHSASFTAAAAISIAQ